MKKGIAYFITIMISALYIVIGYKTVISGSNFLQNEDKTEVLKLLVTTILDEKEDDSIIAGNSSYKDISIVFLGKVISGERKGEYVKAVEQTDPYYYWNMSKVKVGDKVLVGKTDYVENADYAMIDFVRSDAILILALVFCAALVVFGKMKGVRTLISLAFTCLSIFAVFIPAVLSGRNIYLWTILTCLYIIGTTLILVNGFNKKCLCSILGCVFGVATVGLISWIVDKFIRVTGVVNENSIFLRMLNPDKPIDLKAIIFAAIIIGAVGAIMDVSMSISSALYELNCEVEKITPGILLRSGINIGRDMMGTMSNTLILAYIGSSLSFTILLTAYFNSLLDLFNKENIIVELLQALSGSLGILLTIPITSVVCSLIYKSTDREKQLIADTEENYNSDLRESVEGNKDENDH